MKESSMTDYVSSLPSDFTTSILKPLKSWTFFRILQNKARLRPA